MSVHFPDSPNQPPPPAPRPPPTAPTQPVTYAEVANALSSFHSLKAAGQDDIPPIALKHLPYQVISFITDLFNACLSHNYVPNSWCESKAIFIKKAGNKPLDEPKSYRPICLASFLFKSFEKVLKDKLEQANIYPQNISPRQHGFVPNRGTDTALSEVTNAIETALESHQVALAVFLDIEGAFDNFNPRNALNLLDSWGADPAITKTLLNYYQKRKVTGHYAGNTSTLYPDKGSAQGNVLSPPLWNIIINKIADLLTKYQMGGAVLADDIAIVATAHSPTSAAVKLQPILTEIKSWLDTQGLKVSVNKSCTICFHQPNSRPNHAPVFWGQQPIPQKSSTRYLGLTFDETLFWRPHFETLINSAKRDMSLINQSLGKSWGPSPQLTHWTYTAIVRPKLAFAAHIWAGALDTHYLNQQSRKLQRWALTKLGPIREHTPTAGLEIITNTSPLQFYLQGVALKTITRIKNLLNVIPARTGHLTN